jgi:hypothetical protein
MNNNKILYILIFINIIFSIFIFSRIDLLNNNLEELSNVDIIKFEKGDKVELIESNITDEIAEYKIYQ